MKFLVVMCVMLAASAAWAKDSRQAPMPTVSIKGKTYYTGAVKPDNWNRGVTFNIPVVPMRALPAQFDWEAQGVKTPVRDQGSCGSCWAFATTQTLENSIKRFGNRDIDLSEQQVVSCAKEFYGCSGGWFAGDYVQKNGQADEAQFPYTASNAKCKSGLTPAATPAKWGYVGESSRKPTVDEIKAAIMQYGTVSVTVSASGSWSVNSEGVLAGCGNGGTNHMVAVTGWDDSINGGSWKMKNSWGADWGKDGYAWVKWGCYRIGEETAWMVLQDGPGPIPNVPNVDLPTDVMARYGKTIVLAVKADAGVTYAWFKGTVKVGDGPTLALTTTESVVYKVVATNGSGTAEAMVQVTVQL